MFPNPSIFLREGVGALGRSRPQRRLRGRAAAAPPQLPAVLQVQLPAGLVSLVGPGHLRLPADRQLCPGAVGGRPLFQATQHLQRLRGHNSHTARWEIHCHGNDNNLSLVDAKFAKTQYTSE